LVYPQPGPVPEQSISLIYFPQLLFFIHIEHHGILFKYFINMRRVAMLRIRHGKFPLPRTDVSGIEAVETRDET